MSRNEAIAVCRAGELGELEARSIESDPFDEQKRFFVIKKDGRFHAYRNVCPHAGSPLNWAGDRFLSRDGRHLQCALHGALFHIDGGRCFAGPCRGAALTAVPAYVENGTVFIDPDPYRPSGI